VFDESKITGRDFNTEEIVEGNVACSTQESIGEDTVNKSQEIETENKNLKEEGSCIESLKEGGGDDLSPEYIREDESETLKDDQKDEVKSRGEILKESQADGVDESITGETTMIAERSEQIVTSLVKYEKGKQGESSSPVSKEEGSNEDTFSTKVAEEGDDDNGAVTVIETSADVNGEEGLPQAVQEYEPVEGHEKLLDLMPEESKTESSSENAEVVTCTEEEIKIQNIQESLDEEKKEEETTPVNDTKENETEVEEVFEIASTEQEMGEQATREIHTVEDNTQEFNDKETTEENLKEYQVSSEAADSSTDIVGKNSDEQASRELSSSPVGEDTSTESSKQEESYVLSLKEEENEATHAPTSEEQTHTDLKGAKAETKEQVKDIEIDHEEKGLATILTDGAALENVDSEEFSENQIPTVADEGEYNIELAGDKAVDESFQVQSLEEAEPKLRVEDESCESEYHPENNTMIVEEPQLPEQVLDEPKSTGGDFSEGQTIESNAAICTPERIQEETVKNSQDSDKETENLTEEGSSIESVKACNTDDPSQEFILDDGSKKFDDNKQDTVKFEGEILKETEIAGVGESTTYETNQIAESSGEISGASPVKYEEGQPGEGSGQDSEKASKDEDVTEDDDNNGAVTVTESSAEVTSKGEEESEQALEKSEPEEEKVPVKISDVADVKEVCDLEDKASFAEKTTEETSLQIEGHAEVSELVPEKLDVEATEEEFKESSEIVPESDSSSIDVVSKDEIVTSQTLDEGISHEQVEIPSSTLLTEAKEIEASQHEHETPTKDKNIEEEHEKEILADENKRDLSAERSEDETPLQKEESKELKASELSLEKLDAGDTEEGIKESVKTISKSDSQSTDAVSKNEIVADQTHLEASYALLPMEEELKTYQDDRETTTQDKITEEEYPKKTEVPADENGGDLVAATLGEETLLKEEPRELKISELAPENLDADETKEEIKKSFENVSKSDSQSSEVVSRDETTAYQTELAGDKAVEESFQVQSLEEAEPKLRVEDESRESEDHPENDNMIVEEPQLLEQVVDEPKSIDGDSCEGQTTKRNAAICTPERIQEGTAKNSQDSDKETENSQEEIIKELEIAGVGESTTYETNQIDETSEEIFDASPLKYEGRPGECSSQDSAKASKEEDVTEDHDSNGAVTVTESNAEVTSKGEEDSTQPLEKYEPEEEKVPVKISDVADAKEVCNVEDKSSFAEKTTEETSLQTEGHAEVSELAPEKLDVEATEEEFKEGSEIVRESDSRSIDVVSKDEIATSQTLDEGISQEQVEILSSTLLTEAKEIEASPHEHETPTRDKNIEKEHEQGMPADENAGDLSAVRSEDETPLPKEESEELKPSELALEKLNAGDTEEEIKETFKTISKSDSQSTDAVPKDELVADQTHLEASYASLPKEEELKTYQDDRETTTQDKGVEEEYAKETEVPADENGRDLVAPTLAEETLLQKEEPEELKVSELAPENPDAGETEEEIKESFEKVSKSDSQSSEVVSGDETTAYQTLHEGISNEQLQLPSSTLVPEEKEIKISEREHETTTQDKNKEDGSTEKNEVPADENTRDLFVAVTSEEETFLQKEEPREFKACELAPEKLHAGETEEIKETLETISISNSQCIDTVSKDDIVADQTLVGASYTSLPKEKEHEAGENEVPADENGGDLISARSVEETILPKKEPGELKVSELAPEELNAGETEEEIKKTPERVSKPESPSTDVVSRDEAISEQTLHEGISTEKLQIPSSVLLPEEKKIKASEELGTTFSDKNIEDNSSNLQMQDDENTKAISMEEETSLIKEEPGNSKLLILSFNLKQNYQGKVQIKEDEKLPEESEPYSVREESHDENKAKGEKQGEQIDETSTIKTNEHQNELSEVDGKGIASDKYERQVTFEGLSIKEKDPRFIEDKTTHDGFPEEEKRVEEAAFEFVLKNQGDEINSKSSIASSQMEKDSSTEVSRKAPIVETSQGIESNECGKVISTESGTVSLPNLVPESTKETATACKELKTEEDEEEEHEISEQVKTAEEKGENEHKNREAGYESPIMVEASRDADVNVKVVSHKKSNNILSGIKHSMSKVKKAITGKSSHSKTKSEK
ncbi:titin-like, partial [Pyrus ussuriensis x Pyrus communis]